MLSRFVEEKNKSFTIIIVAILVVVSVMIGMGKNANNGKKENVITYENSSTTAKEAIDLICKNREKWSAHVKDSGKEFSCTNVGFYKSSNTGKVIFVACFRFNTQGACSFGVYEITGGEFKSYAIPIGNMEKSTAMVTGLSGAQYNDSMQEDELKNILAEEISSYY